MTDTTDTLARLRACPAVRELAEEMALPYYDGAGWGALVEQTLHLLTSTDDPLWTYYRAVLRVLAEGRDTRPWHGSISNRAFFWLALERGPVEAFLAECCEVLGA